MQREMSVVRGDRMSEAAVVAKIEKELLVNKSE